MKIEDFLKIKESELKLIEQDVKRKTIDLHGLYKKKSSAVQEWTSLKTNFNKLESKILNIILANMEGLDAVSLEYRELSKKIKEKNNEINDHQTNIHIISEEVKTLNARFKELHVIIQEVKQVDNNEL